MKKKIFRLMFVPALCMSIIAGFMFYFLLSRPFGFLFNTSFYLLAGGLVIVFFALAYLSIKSSKRWLKVIGVLPGLLSVSIFLIAMAVSIDMRMVYFTGIPPKPTNDEWIKDMHFLAGQMQEKYPDLYSKVSEDDFKSAVKEIEEQIPNLSESDIVMELFRLTALPNDAHTIPFVFLPCFDFHDFPIKIYKFDDGWYIIDAANAYKDLIGSKLLKVGTTSIDELFLKFKPYLSAENEYAQLERFTYIGLMPEWLKSQGVINNLSTAQFTLKKENGEQVFENMKAVKFPLKFYWSFIRPVDNRTAPAILNPRRDWYWFEFLENSKTIYFQFNKVENQGGKETIAEFSKRLEDFVNANDFDRFVVDIRNNMGGNDFYLMPLLKLIRDNPKINQKNKIFVLTGRNSFSSAVLFSNKLKLQTKAIFIGEPTAQGSVFGGNPTFFQLPNSKLYFAVATTSTAGTQAPWPFKTGNTIAPDTIVPYTFEDFKTGRDPVMELTLKYKLNEPESETLPETILDNYTGRFILSPLVVLEVKRNETKLSFTISDFTDHNLFRVQSDLYAKSENVFATDINNVNISFPKDSVGGISSLVLNWEGQIRILKRAPKDYTTALELLSQNRIDEAIIQIKQNGEQYKNLRFIENQLINAGYEYLSQNKFDEAIDIFSVVTGLFPESWNAFDSLGEAYLKAGNKDLAIANYKKSLELNPESATGKAALDKLN